ncbi:MAG: hypothetical protein JXM70_21560, partial [Pirellulales bacterium]|nr:hypothetical protein [Pirellulales bacterium]
MKESEQAEIFNDDEQPQEDQEDHGDCEEQKTTAPLKVNTLEPRILLSATWVEADTGAEHEGPTEGDDVFHGDDADNLADAMGGDDVLFGGDGHDQLFGGRGDDDVFGGAGDDELFGGEGHDVLIGGEGDDLLDGGEGDDLLDGGDGHDTVDYSHSASAVNVDLTAGIVSAEDGTDTLVDVEHVTGSEHDDTFEFSEPVNGAIYSLDGGGGSNTIDLSNFSRDDAVFSNGKLTVDLGEGQSFTIKHDNISDVQFSDKHVDFVVWDGDGDSDSLSDAENFSGDSAPDADDILVFDDTSGDNAVFDADFEGTVGGILVSDGYTGRITLESDITIDGDLDIAGGTFDAGDHDLEIDGDLHVQGGHFEASSGTTSITGDFIIDDGTFDDNNGTLEFTGDHDQVMQLDGLTLDNVVIDKASGTLTLQNDIDISGDFTHVSGEVVA